jgi:IS30 family transposase
MQTSTTYRQLQPEERMTIASLRQARSGVRAIARALGRSPGTVSRELARNADGDGSYSSLPAQALSRARQSQERHPSRWRFFYGRKFDTTRHLRCCADR